jgi:hypothetical protein
VLRLDGTLAEHILREEAAKALQDPGDAAWIKKVERLSDMCEASGMRTHIAFLGTALLAKSVDRRADLYWIKPKHASEAPNAFSARSFAHGILVPMSAALGFSLGVTGREPLNNQPYFRMTRLDDGTPVHQASKPSFDYMLTLIKELQDVPSEAIARDALRAYITVRTRYQTRYGASSGAFAITPEALLSVIATFVSETSEGGKRAQAVVAGLFDVVVGEERVISDRINDPSRRHPGDVVVMDDEIVEKAIEVKDKPASESDIQLFARKCVSKGTREAAYVMVSRTQAPLNEPGLQRWAADLGIGLTLFHGWPELVTQALFWAPAPRHEAAVAVAERVRERLVGVEANPESVSRWEALIALNAPKTRP